MRKYIPLLAICAFACNNPSLLGQNVAGDLNRDGRISVCDLARIIGIEQGQLPIDDDAEECQERYTIRVGIGSTEQLSAEGSHWADDTRLIFSPDATPHYEIGRDISKFWSEDETVPQICTTDMDGQYCGIQEVPHSSCCVTLVIKIQEFTEHQIGLTTSSPIPIYLIDRALHTYHCLNDGPYSFTSLPGTYSTRFALAKEPFIRADLNCDTSINNKDIDLLLKAIL